VVGNLHGSGDAGYDVVVHTAAFFSSGQVCSTTYPNHLYCYLIHSFSLHSCCHSSVCLSFPACYPKQGVLVHLEGRFGSCGASGYPHNVGGCVPLQTERQTFDIVTATTPNCLTYTPFTSCTATFKRYTSALPLLQLYLRPLVTASAAM